MPNGCCEERRWNPRHKHLPPARELWDKSIIVAQTGKPRQPARYSPRMTGRIEDLELETVGQNELPQTRLNVHRFWRNAGTEIGASNGKRTTYIYVECNMSGDVHGRPITRDELKKKGAEL